MQVSPQRLGEELVAAELVSAEALQATLAALRDDPRRLEDALVERGAVDEVKLLRFLATRARSKYVSTAKLSLSNIADPVLEKLSVRDAERLNALPLAFDKKKNTLSVAIDDVDEGLLEEVRSLSGAEAVVAVLALPSAVRAGINRFYYSDKYAFAALERDALVAKLTPTEGKAQVVARVKHGSGSFPDIAAKLGKTAQKEEPTERAAQPLKTTSATGQTKLTIAQLTRTIEEQKRTISMLRVANELHGHLARERNVGDLARRILAFAFDLLPADDGVVLLEQGDGGALEPRAVKTRSGKEAEVEFSETLLSEVLSTSSGVLTQDAVKDPRFKGSNTASLKKLRSAMGVPLIVDGEVAGAILLATREKSGVFTSEDLETLSAIAAQASTAIENAQLARKVAADAATRERLSRFLSPAVVDMASNGRLDLREAGELQDATILFADIRGFTAMSEQHSPAEVVALLNEHFESLAEIVFAHGGLLDKFLGDAVMALWGVPMRSDDHAQRALLAGLEMLERVRAMNEQRRAVGREPLEIGVGVNTGPVIFGAIGASRRLELTAVGDAVNTASRLCSLAQPGQLVTSGDTLVAAGDAFDVEALPPVALRGKTHAMRAYAVLRVRQAARAARK